MPKYTCDFCVTIWGTATAEAPSPEAAYDAVLEATSDEYQRSVSLYLGDTVEFEYPEEGGEGKLTLDDSCEIDVHLPAEVSHE
jgi:hypothetical protein